MVTRQDILIAAKNPIIRAGLIIQSLSSFVLVLFVIAMRMKWIDIVGMGLENGINAPSPKLDALLLGLRILILAFASSFILYAVAFYRRKPEGKAQSAPRGLTR